MDSHKPGISKQIYTSHCDPPELSERWNNIIHEYVNYLTTA
jgi:hypothetical protein